MGNGFVEEPIYAELARLGKALASPVRLRLLDVLDSGELTVEELATACGLPVKNTSAQLQQLRAVHLVESRRDGTRIHYRVASQTVSAFLGRLHDFAQDTQAELRERITAHLGTGDQLEPVTVAGLAELMAGNQVTVLDVRSEAAYARGHIPGAISLPLHELAHRMDELRGHDLIVAYCQGPYCVSSPDAVRLMTEAGHRARSLNGGWTAWVRATA
ncbi:MAG TPA: metalloregulator ArsR/SmtB family transcription factor [Pseudonocardiaceae bacterium]|nr:metalloregulator ArsR/SmtB family transcription factor [Pseudonocardiaceae bacterium]